MTGVSWRRALVVLATVAVALIGTIVAIRGDGFSAVDATVPRATRWFVHQPSKRVVLADGFAGKALAALNPETDERLSLVQSPTGVSLLEPDVGVARSIDAAQLRIGPRTTLGLIDRPGTVVGVGQPGLIAVEPGDRDGVLLPPDGEQVSFLIGELGDQVRISPDGAIWSVIDGNFTRKTIAGDRDVLARRLGRAAFTMAGNTPLLLDRDGARTRFGDGAWVDLPDGAAPSEVVLQEPGPQASCAWLATQDLMWCVGADGVELVRTVEGLNAMSTDRLAVAGDAAAIVRSSTSQIFRIDWHRGEILDGPDDRIADVRDGATLDIASSVDLIWLDDVEGDDVWSVHPWGITSIDKNDERTPVIDDSGQVIDGGEAADADEPGFGDSSSADVPEPDGDAFDDPPIAVDDAVSSRFGVAAAIVVTANDWDPDGEAIAVVEVEQARNGDVSISSASTVTYSPKPAFVGTDSFEYTIADGNGTRASAVVTVQVLPVDAPNRAPVGAPDTAETGAGAPVIVDVLANDVDPERDALQIGAFTEANIGGEVTLTRGPTELLALEYTPPADARGTATFRYQPVDSLGALGEFVTVTVTVASGDGENREPVTRPDAVRLRLDNPTLVDVLGNDRDPDGDSLVLAVDQSLLPPGLEVAVRDGKLEITARAGVDALAPFSYTADDREADPVVGHVLVSVIDDSSPNQPPVASADTYSAVVGESQMLDVLANDSDPDGDTIVLQSVRPADPNSVLGTATVRGRRIEYVAGEIDSEDPVFERLVYEISDGEATAIGEVTIRVLPEVAELPPFARDDSASTTTDTPVFIDVLRNDGDPSGRSLSIVNASCPSGAGEVVRTDDKILYTPPQRADVYTCSYSVANADGQTDDAKIVVSVTEPPLTNRPPVVATINRSVEAGSTTDIDLLSTATDPDSPLSSLAVQSWRDPRFGTAVEVDARTLRYTAPDRPGPDSITFTVGDDQGASADGRVSITVTDPEPVPPVAVTDEQSIDLPAPYRFSVLTNDEDADAVTGEELTVTGASLVSGDATVTHDDVSVTITPADDFLGTVRVTYDIVDVDGLTDTGEIRLTVLAIPNRAPDALDDSGQVINGGRVVVAIGANDTDPDADALTYRIVTPPSSGFGTASIDGASLVFDAVPGASGQATIVYEVSDGELTDRATVTITVQPCTVAPPIGVDGKALTTGYMQPIAVDLTQYAQNGEVIEVSAPLGQPIGVFTPPAGYNDTQTITFVVRNACGQRDAGSVLIDVNRPPVATATNIPMGRFESKVWSVVDLATDPDNQGLRIVGLQNAPSWVTVGPGSDRIVVDPQGAFGQHTFGVVIHDVGDLQVVTTVTVDLANQAPTAANDSVRADEGAVVIHPLDNDTDPEGDVLQLQQVPATVTFTNDVTVPLVVNERRTTISVDPGVGVGVASFTYTVVDVAGRESNQATITITVNSPPDAPTVDVSMAAGSTVTVQVPATDPDGGELSLELIDDPSPLTIEIDGLTLRITAPASAANTLFAITYRVTDPFGARDRGVLNIDVGAAPPTTTTTTTTTTTLPPATTRPPGTTLPEQPT